jgi:hypothetical protein
MADLAKDLDQTPVRFCLSLHETQNGSLRVLAPNDLAARVLESLPKNGTRDAVFAGVPYRMSRLKFLQSRVSCRSERNS